MLNRQPGCKRQVKSREEATLKQEDCLDVLDDQALPAGELHGVGARDGPMGTGMVIN